ncbi:vWA domain-containing protein, partial [Dactylosporangium fulvum]|uniref:vWA domain-containing protein n=1 Tax=Dactylosporangium fulvum TaxID=53359 RepID=UPI0031D76727
RDAARLALPHRRRRDPLDPPGADLERLEEILEQEAPDEEPPADGGPDAGPDTDPSGGPAGGPAGGSDGGSDGDPGDGPGDGPGGGPGDGPDGRGRDPGPRDAGPAASNNGPGRPPADTGGSEGAGDAVQAPSAAAFAGVPYRPRLLTVAGRANRQPGSHAGRRSPAVSRHGRVVRSRRPLGGKIVALHLPDTVRAAALRGARAVTPDDVREAVKVGREANLVLFVVDASGSMAARQRMSVVKTAVLSLLRDAYQRRDKVGMITFRGRQATTVLEPTASHEVGVLRLAELRTGGRTPLAAGLRQAAHTLHGERRRHAGRRALLVVVTDGRATDGPDPLTVAPLLAGVATVVVDCESGPIRLGLAQRLARALDASCIPLAALQDRS